MFWKKFCLRCSAVQIKVWSNCLYRLSAHPRRPINSSSEEGSRKHCNFATFYISLIVYIEFGVIFSNWTWFTARPKDVPPPRPENAHRWTKSSAQLAKILFPADASKCSGSWHKISCFKKLEFETSSYTRTVIQKLKCTGYWVVPCYKIENLNTKFFGPIQIYYCFKKSLQIYVVDEYLENCSGQLEDEICLIKCLWFVQRESLRDR